MKDIIEWNNENGEPILFEDWRFGTVRCSDCFNLAWKGEQACCRVEKNEIVAYPPIPYNDSKKWRKCIRFTYNREDDLKSIMDAHRIS